MSDDCWLAQPFAQLTPCGGFGASSFPNRSASDPSGYCSSACSWSVGNAVLPSSSSVRMAAEICDEALDPPIALGPNRQVTNDGT